MESRICIYPTAFDDMQLVRFEGATRLRIDGNRRADTLPVDTSDFAIVFLRQQLRYFLFFDVYPLGDTRNMDAKTDV